MVLGKKSVLLSGGMLIGLAGVLCLAGPARADIYQYVDAQGVIHLTNVPKGPAYRLVLKERVRKSRAPRIHTARVNRYRDIIHRVAARHRMDPKLVAAVVQAESGFNPRAVSRKGAMGLMQLMPETASLLRVDNPFDPEQNLDAGVRYLKRLLGIFDGDLRLSLAAYNAGVQAVKRYGTVPPYRETRGYVKKVLQYYRGRGGSVVPPRPIYRVERTDGSILFTDAVPSNGVRHVTRIR